MRTAPTTSEHIHVHVPFRVVRRGGRKEMVLPGNSPEGATEPRRSDSTLVKALARAFRWKRMLEAGEVATIADLARQERIAPSYLTRILRLTFLAPDIVEAILDGHQAISLTAEALRADFDDDWDLQRRSLDRAP